MRDGDPAQTERPPTFALARLGVLLAFAVALVPLAADLTRPFGNGDEVLYAQGIREMQRGAGHRFLHWGGHEVLERPVLPIAIADVISRPAAGFLPLEVALRAASFLAAFGCLVLVYRIARRRFGRRDAAVAGVLLCGLAPSFHLHGGALLSDPPFALALIAALGATLWADEDPRGLIAAGLALGAAVALKSLAAGPAVVALAPWLALAARRHRARRAAALAVVGFVLLAAPFFVVGLVARGGQFVDEHLGRALIARAAGELSHLGMSGGPLAYVRYLVAVDGPLVAAWIALGTVGAVVVAARRRDRPLAIVGCFGLACFVLLSLVGTRLPHYLLPIYPAAAIGVAGVVARLLSSVSASGTAARGPVPGVAAVAAAAAVALAGLGRRAAEAHYMPDLAAVALGRAAADAVPPGQPIHALEWYAPALAYYADRPLRIATASDGLFALVDAVDYFHATGVPERVPLRAAAARAPFWLAGPRAAIAVAAAPGGWLTVEAELAVSGDHALVRARLIE